MNSIFNRTEHDVYFKSSIIIQLHVGNKDMRVNNQHIIDIYVQIHHIN